jgi:hypothetical protein
VQHHTQLMYHFLLQLHLFTFNGAHVPVFLTNACYFLIKNK